MDYARSITWVRKNKLKIILGFFLFLLLLVIHFKLRQPSLVSLTLYYKESPCSPPVDTRKKCNVPNPASTTFTLELPSGLRGDERVTRYENSVRLTMMVPVTEFGVIESYWRASSDERDRLNYIHAPTGDVIIRSTDTTETWQQFVEKVMIDWNRGRRDYVQVATNVPNARLFDDEICRDMKLDDTETKEASKLPIVCFVRNQIYIPELYKQAMVACRVGLLVNGKREVTPCKVRSRVASGAEVQYSISGKYFQDGSWVKYDKRIRQYLLRFRVPIVK